MYTWAVSWQKGILLAKSINNYQIVKDVEVYDTSSCGYYNVTSSKMEGYIRFSFGKRKRI